MTTTERSSVQGSPRPAALGAAGRLLALLLALPLAAPLAAHDPGLSSALARVRGAHSHGSAASVHGDGLELALIFANADAAAAVAGLDRDRDGTVSAAEVAGGHAQLEAFARAGFLVASRGRQLQASSVIARIAENADVRLDLRFDATIAAPLRFEAALFAQLPRGHKQYFALLGERDAKLADAMLDQDRRSYEHAALTGAEPAGASFFVLGVEHVLTGYDHVLFLLALLLASRSLRATLAVITSFTLAHSLTLAAAALDWVHLSSSLVEPVIALSIVWVGVENLLRAEPRRRWLTTFVFGLMHGFGFASVLRGLGIGESGSVAGPLLTFNLGVETGQVLVALAAAPLLWWLRRSGRSRPVVIGGSVLVALAGAVWLVERI